MKKQIHYSNGLPNLETDNLQYQILEVWADLWLLNYYKLDKSSG